MSGQIETERRPGTLHVRLNRPDKRNALTHAMYVDLRTAFEQAEAAPDIRIIHLSGSGGAFTAGNDLADFLHSPPSGTDSPTLLFVRALAANTKLLVAEVDGPAVGLGTTMLLHCDLVYATARAVLAMPFVNLGLVPEAGSTLLLPRRVGPAAAARLAYFGEPVTAAEAARLGLVTEVLPDPDALRARVADRLRALLAQPPEALAATRSLLHGDPREVLARIEVESTVFAERLASPESRAAMTAALAGRRGPAGRENGTGS